MCIFGFTVNSIYICENYVCVKRLLHTVQTTTLEKLPKEILMESPNFGRHSQQEEEKKKKKNQPNNNE